MIYGCLCNFTNIVGFNDNRDYIVNCRAELKNFSVVPILKGAIYPLVPLSFKNIKRQGWQFPLLPCFRRP